MLTEKRKQKLKFALGKLSKALFTIWLVTTLIFFLIRLMPSNPVDVYVQQLITNYGFSMEEARARASTIFSIDLEASLFSQYMSYLGGLLRGDLGESILSPGVKVTDIILKRLPWTLFTVGLGLLISFVIGTILGAIMAFRRDRWYEPVITGVASVMGSIPDFIIAIFLILAFGVIQWGSRASSLVSIQYLRGTFTPGITPGFSWAFAKDILLHGALPILTYVIAQVGTWILLMKGSTIATLNQDYVQLATARGIPSRRILYRYIGRNAMLPIATELAIRIGFILGGSLIIEQLFVYQGLGLELLNAVHARDYTLMQGIFLVLTTAIVLSNLFAEYLYGVLDPRVSKE